MVNCFMLLDPKQTFSLNVMKTYIIQLRLSLQAPPLPPADTENGSHLQAISAALPPNLECF
jgi:hypothetical protein